MKDRFLVLFLGSKWWGADSRALGSAFRRHGHLLVEVDRLDYFPVRWEGFLLKVIRRLIKQLSTKEYNNAILQHANNKAINFVLVCKGSYIYPSTLERLKALNIPVYCFYPDVSFQDHGSELWQGLPLYDCVFTTKSFHVDDPLIRKYVANIHLVSHGFDPEVHRKIEVPDRAQAHYACDVSFVGAWSPKKERIIAHLANELPEIDLKVWGPSWWRADEIAKGKWQGRAIRGDELALVYQCAKINLGILSSTGGGVRKGDQVTTRTWQVPSCGGFLLHEYTEELLQYFSPDVDVVTFSSDTDLINKVRFFIENEEIRNSIASAAKLRCANSNYSYDVVARKILKYFESDLGVKSRVVKN